MMRILAVSCLLLCTLSWRDARVPRAEDEVTYESQGIPLVATLLLPEGPGPFPAVVLVHGSGSSDRSNPWTRAYAAALVERGIAVLHPDKRGSGASGGDWRQASIPDLAEDARAAVRVLQRHPFVDGQRVGLMGFSQGGDVVPLAATGVAEVAFVIDVSGSVVPLGEQIEDELLRMARRTGLTEQDLAHVRAIHEAALTHARTREGWEEYRAALAAARSAGLGGSEVLEGFPVEQDSWVWSFLAKIVDYDPLPYWRQLEVPALFLFGGNDENVDVAKSVDVIQRVLGSSNLSYGLLLFGKNGHALYREDALDFIARWIRDGGVD